MSVIADYFRKFDSRLWALALGWIASAVGFSLVIPFLAVYFHSELGISMTNIGLFFAVVAVVRAVFQVLGGELSDRFGRFYIMVFAQFIRTLIFIFLAYAISRQYSFLGIGVLILLNSIFGAMFQPAANATVADLVEKKYRTEAYSIVRVAGNFGWAVGPALGGFFAAKSYAVLFVISGGMTLLSSCIIAFSLRGIRSFPKTEGSFNIKDILSIGRGDLIFKHAALMFVLYLVISQLITPLSLYTVDFCGITYKQLGILFTLNGLLVAGFQIPTTRLLKSVRLSIQLALGAAIFALGYFWVGLVSTFVMFIIAIIIITVGENFVSPPALSITANLAPKGRVGRYMGIYGFAVTAGWSLGPFVSGILMDLVKPDFVYFWGIISALALLSSFGFTRLTKQIPLKFNLYKET